MSGAGSCLLIPRSFVILFDFASKAWRRGRKEEERGPWTRGRDRGVGGYGRPGGVSDDDAVEDRTQEKGKSGR